MGSKLGAITAPVIERGVPFKAGQLAAPELPAQAGALSAQMQDIARSYLGARRQSGVSLLEAARWLSEAKDAAKHGEWAVFLEAIGLDDSRARAQIRIHEEAQRNPLFADRIINGFLSETVARELLPLPAEQREELLARETPPTAADVREAKRVLTPVLEPITSESRDADGPWFKASKSAAHPTAHHWNIRPTTQGRYVAACGIEVTELPTAGADAGLCSVCAKHGDRRELVPIPLPPPAAPDFDAAQARAAALGRTLSRHGGWWQLEHAGYKQPAAPPTDVLSEIARLETAPITVRTTDGTRETVPLRVSGALALHTSQVAGGAFTITHVPSGRSVGQFARSLSANGAFTQLADLDWSQVRDGHTGPDLRQQIDTVLIQYPDARGHAERIAAPVVAPETGEPEKEKQRTENKEAVPASAFDRPTGRTSSSFSPQEYEEWAETDQILLDKAANAIQRRDMDVAETLLSQIVVKTAARDELLAQLPDQAALWRAQAAALLRQLTPLIAQLKTEKQEDLSMAIANLNECAEGAEAQHWLAVGWALLDLES
jgi:hypothetical protein